MRSTGGVARHLLEANETRLTELAPLMLDVVAEELDLPPLSAENKWPTDVVAATREFLVCVAHDDMPRLGARGGTFESVGVEAARGGVDFEVLASGLRLCTRLIQAQVHRAVLRDPLGVEPKSVLELLDRVLVAGESVIAAARRGHELAGLVGEDEGELGRHLASELISGGPRVQELAERLGWDASGAVCAVITSPAGGARIAAVTTPRPAWFTRARDVVLALPLPADRLATSLRPLLGDIDCVVGSAVPLRDFTDSLALGQRLARPSSGGVDGRGDATFADDVLLDLACTAEPAVVAALRRKYFGELDALPAETRALLTDTLYEWLRQWGHRPGIARTLEVHPQTVSGRISRLKDLLADDLEDPGVRAELLVLLIADRAEVTGATRPGR